MTKMIPEQLRANERGIIDAVTHRQYKDLPARLEILRQMADAYVTSLPADDPLRREMAGKILATMRWARLMLTVQRQVWSDQLERLPGIGRYLDRPTNATPRVCVDL
jgi:hypothetical protein